MIVHTSNEDKSDIQQPGRNDSRDKRVQSVLSKRKTNFVVPGDHLSGDPRERVDFLSYKNKPKPKKGNQVNVSSLRTKIKDRLSFRKGEVSIVKWG